MTTSTPAHQPEYVVCVDNADYPVSLELHKIYRTLLDDDAVRSGDLRIVDESGDPLPNCEGDSFGGSIHFMTVSDEGGGNQHSGKVDCRGSYFVLIEVLDGNSNFIDRTELYRS